MNLNQDKFIDMCILFGCDYIKPVIRNNPTKIYYQILESKSIRNIIIDEENDKCDIDKYLENHE